MTFRSFTVSAIIAIGGLSAFAAKPLYQNPKAPIDARVEDLLSRMTLEEKVLQLRTLQVGDENSVEPYFGPHSYGSTYEMQHNAVDAAKAFKKLHEQMKKENRLGIPVLVTCEGIQGIIQDSCTLFPVSLAQASTWNPELIEEMTAACGREGRAIGIRQVLSPVLDLARELRWGRVEETFGEDPFLSAEMGKAFVNGYQSEGVLAMIKHFVAHGSPYGGLNTATVPGGEHEFRSIYLYPFKKVIAEAKPGAVMTCYSAYDAVPVTGSKHFLTDILRNELGHTGYIYSDWHSVERIYSFHHAVASPEDAAVKAVKSGLDMEVGWTYSTLPESVRQGKVDESVIDDACRRILRKKFELGLFEGDPINPDKVMSAIHTPENIALAKQVADESVILLENKNNILPLDLNKYKKILIVGPNGHFAAMGDYAWVNCDGKQGTDLFEGLTDRTAGKATVSFSEGCDWWSTNMSKIPDAVKAAEEADLVIAAVGTRSYYLARPMDKPTAGEGFDLSSLELPGRQQELLEAIKATGKPMIVTLIGGKPLVMKWAQENADAVLAQWYGGEEQGNALADVLLGNVNPSGKLTVSFPRSTGNTPCFYNHYPTDRVETVERGGGPDNPQFHYVFELPEPLWNFGRGLSYTTFEYSDLQIDNLNPTDKDTLTVRVNVKNTGEREGKETVQLYVWDKISTVLTPIQQLKGFKKINLKPGETKTVELTLPISELALFNEEMQEVVEPGEFEIQIGSASDDIRAAQTIVVK